MSKVDQTSSSSSTTRSTTGGGDNPVLTSIQNLPRESWEMVIAQARDGLGVTDAQPELMALYRQVLKQLGAKDTPQNRIGFIAQMDARLDQKVKQLSNENGSSPTLGEAVAGMGEWSPADEKQFQTLIPKPNAERERRTDRFERSRPTGTNPAFKPGNTGPITVNTLEEFYESRAKTPDEALSMRTDKVARDDGFVKKLETAVAKGQNPFTGDAGEVGRRAYVDFLTQRGVSDSPQTRKLFVELLKERKAAQTANGGKALDVQGDKKFWASAALKRLEGRQPNAQGVIELKPDERWMISALSDPKVQLTPDQQKLINNVAWRDSMGLRTFVGELGAKRKAASEWRPALGQGYKATLNASTVFDGDPQKNAYTMAAKAGGFTDAEIALAQKFCADNGMGLYVQRNTPGEPQITKLEEAEPRNVGGQNFVDYTMTTKGAQVLRDARYALEHGYDSVEAYRKDFDTTWADNVGWLGQKALEAEQSKDRTLGFEQNSVLGPLMRGKYDAMRELILVGSNAAQFAEMFVDNTKQFVKTGDPFVSIAKSEELNRYYDASANRVEQTFSELGKTYSDKEEGLVAEIARGTVAGVPKMAVNLIPGAAIYYNALKHANHDLNEFGKETVIDLASIAGGFALSRVTSAGSALASKYLNNQLAQTVVKQVVERGGSAIGGATMNVALDMGPAAVKQLMGGATTEADKREAAEKLTMAAFKRNVWSGIVFGLIAPGKHQKDDFITLSKPGTSLEGPLFKTMTPDGERYYSAAKITENGKTRVEFLEADPQSPKVQTAIREGLVKEARQPDIDYALAQSRWSKLSPDEQTKLASQANTYAAKKTIADAETAVAYSESKPAMDPKELAKSAQDGKEGLLAAYKQLAAQTGTSVDPVMAMTLSKATPAELGKAFGPGPYTLALAELYKQPGFSELVKSNPVAANTLYRANEYTNISQRLRDNSAALKSTVEPAKLGEATLATTLRQLEQEGTTVKRENGFVTVDRVPGKTNNWAYEMVLIDDAMKQPTPRVIEVDAVQNGATVKQKVISFDQKSDHPSRVTFDPAQLGIDPKKSAMLLTHGAINGLDKVTREQLTVIAKKLVEKGEIDNLVLVACNQGDLRPDGGTNAVRFMQDLNAKVKELSGGKRSIEVFASKEPGVLYPELGNFQGDVKVNVSVPDPRVREYIPLPNTEKRVEMVPVLLQDKALAVPPEWYGTAPVKTKSGERPAFIYVIRVNESGEQK